jgi:hypothetical protein
MTTVRVRGSARARPHIRRITHVWYEYDRDPAGGRAEGVKPMTAPTTGGTCPETEGPCSQCGKETFVYATDGTRLFSRHLDLHVYPADHEVVFPAYMAPGYGRSRTVSN